MIEIEEAACCCRVILFLGHHCHTSIHTVHSVVKDCRKLSLLFVEALKY